MKLLRLTLILITVLASCQQSNNTVKKKSQIGFDLTTLPTDWVRLTKTDSGFIIYNSCDAGNLLLRILKNKETTGLLLHGQQEDDEFVVLKCLLTENDTAIIKAKWKNSEELQDFKFIWADKEKKLGRWITTYLNGFTSDFTFVTADNQTYFPRIDQPCRECWGDECDEIEEDIKKDTIDTNKSGL